MSGTSSGSPGGISFVHSRRKDRATAGSAWKMVTGTAFCDVGASVGFLVMMYCALRPLSLTMSLPMKAPSRRAVVHADDFLSPYSARLLDMVVASEM